MDGIDVSRGDDGVRQRQHRIVPRNMYPVPIRLPLRLSSSRLSISFSRTCCLFDS